MSFPGHERTAGAATITVVTAGVIAAMPELAPSQRGPCIALAVLYIALQFIADFRRQSAMRPGEGVAPVGHEFDRVNAALFALSTAVGFVLLVMTRGSAFLVIMPSISSLTIDGRPLGSILLGGLVLVVLGLVALPAGISGLAALGMMVGPTAAMTFVIAFSHLIQAERRARLEMAILAAELEQANTRLREYTTVVEDLAATKERNRIAREIHDGLGHCLTIVNVQLEAARVLSPSDMPRALECVGRAHAMAQRGLDEVRQSVAVLRERPADALPLPAMLAALAEESKTSGLDVRLIVSGEPRPLSAQAHATIFRAAQEGLTNVRRHARATSASLALSFAPGEVSLALQDDGAGAEAAGGGFGLLGLRERVHLVGGAVEVRTSPGAGFFLGVKVPA